MLRFVRRSLSLPHPFWRERWFYPLSAWLAFMVLMPVFDFVSAGRAYPALAGLGVLLQAGAVVSLLSGAWPRRRLLVTALVITMMTWLAEWIGHTTGLPFGDYTYSDVLQPQLLGVPLLIPLAWWMMLPPAWAVASAVVAPQKRLTFAAVAGLAFTAWDLYLDPQMVSRGLWLWADPGPYFGIPLLNFFGWWLVSALVTLACAPVALPRRPLAMIYTLTWILQVVGLGVFWGQPGPALIGFVAMGAWVILFWTAQVGHEQRTASPSQV
jgi:putative membrane protein